MRVPIPPAGVSTATIDRRLPLSLVLPSGAAGAGVFAVAAALTASGPHVVHHVLLGAVLVSAVVCDLRTGRVPNRLTLAAGVVACFRLGLDPAVSLWGGLLGASAAAIALLGIRGAGTLFFGRPGMGMGDVKLGLVLGLLVGPQVLWGLYLAVVLGGVVGSVLLIGSGQDRARLMIFAPFIAMGMFLSEYVLPFGRMWEIYLASLS